MPGMPGAPRASGAAMTLKQNLACALVLASVAACGPRPSSATPASPELAPADSTATPAVADDPDRADEDDLAVEAARWSTASDEEATRLRALFPGATVRIAVLDARTGRVLAKSGPVESPHDTGSTLKSLTVAAALAEGASADTQVDCSAPVRVDGLEVSDFAVHGKITVKEALARSSNVAIVQLAVRLGWRPLYDRVSALVPLPDPAGLGESEAVALLFGGTSRLSTLELARGYATLAADGRDPASGSSWVSAEIADEVIAMLRHAVEGEHGTGRQAAVEGVPIAGKTGTARTGDRQTALFVGVVGSGEDARVVAVVVENVGESDFGSTVAAPAFARIVKGARA